MGFEPTTASLEGWNSTTELRPPYYSPRSRIQHAHSLVYVRLAHSQARRPTQAHTLTRTCGFYPVAKNNKIGSGSSKLCMVGRQGFEPWKT